MDTISIEDMEVRFRVGVPAKERSQPQRLLISVKMDLDFRPAAAADDLTKTVNYFEVYQAIARMGDDRQWKLIESLADDVAALVMKQSLVQCVRVEVKKFILPDTRHVAVRIERRR